LSWSRRTPTGWELAIHVQPGARRSEVAGVHGTRLKLRIQAPPVDGRANEAVIAFLAERLGVRRSLVRIVAGDTAREKRVAVDAPDADPATLLQPPA
jgi:uncharacterized protein (TIGR00251 family)